MAHHDPNSVSYREGHAKPADSIYACDPQWGQPADTHVTPPIGEPDPNIEKVFEDQADKAPRYDPTVVPNRDEVVDERSSWQDNHVNELELETAKQIAAARTRAHGEGKPPLTMFKVTLSSAFIDGSVVSLLVQRLRVYGWTCEHNYSASEAEFEIELT